MHAIWREEELLRQLAAAARVIGEVSLEQAFEDVIGRMKHELIFAASLYL